MQLTRIDAPELFSFETLALGELDRRLVVVGPNGAGKTNIVRLGDRASSDRACSDLLRGRQPRAGALRGSTPVRGFTNRRV
jgi:hypothetical protein